MSMYAYISPLFSGSKSSMWPCSELHLYRFQGQTSFKCQFRQLPALAFPLGRKQVLRLFKVCLRICRNTEQHIKSNARLKCVCNQTIPYQRRPAVDLGIEMYMLNYAIPTKSISWFRYASGRLVHFVRKFLLQPFWLQSSFRFHFVLAPAAGPASAPYLAPVSVSSDLPPVSVASDVLCLIW